MQKKKNRRPSRSGALALPIDLPFGKASWLTPRRLRWTTTSLCTAALALPLLRWIASQPQPIWLQGLLAAISILFVAGLGLGVSWLSLRSLRQNALDNKERALSSLALMLMGSGLIGVWQNVSGLSFLLGLFVFAAGLSLSLYVITVYLAAGDWLAKVWSQKNPAWRIREERMLSGWDDLPKVVSSSEDETFDTLLLRYEEDPGDDAPYRQADKEVPYARVPFEKNLAKRLIRRAIGAQVAKVSCSLLLLLPLFYRASSTQSTASELCTTQNFIDLIETERGLFTMTQNGKLLLQRHNKSWNILPSQAPDGILITGIWGIHDALFTSTDDGIYHVDLNNGAWRALYQSKEVLNDIYGFELPGGSLVLMAVGAHGTVVRSMDSGEHWTVQDLDVSNSLYAIWGSLYGGFYVVGSEGFISYTNNNGADWETPESPTTEALVSIWGSEASGKTPERIYAIGEAGTVIFGTDNVWNKFDDFSKLRPSGIFGTVDTTSVEGQKSSRAKIKEIYVVGQQGAITRHNGFGWSPLHSGTGGALWGGLVNDEGIFVVGNNGSLLFSDNDGEYFTPLVSSLEALMRCSGI